MRPKGNCGCLKAGMVLATQCLPQTPPFSFHSLLISRPKMQYHTLFRCLFLCMSWLLVQAMVEAQDPLLVATTEALSPAEELKALKVPKGFKVQLVAAEPDIHKPMNLAWDDQGRLWVTSTLEYPYPAKDLKTARDKVHILSDFDEQGKARTITTFAEGLNIPIGLLPLPGSSPRRALVFHIGEIMLLEDTNGDGRADKRTTILKGYGSRDTHGMTNAFTHSPDGWIYATHGFANESEIRGTDGRSLKLQSGNTYRFRPDGTGLEQYTFGQVNPFGLAMDEWGNLYTADCHTRPVYGLLRGAYYPSFGKPHDGLGFGPEMCKHDHGSTGIAGCLIYAGSQFPKEFQGNIFLGNVVTSRINRDRIDFRGSSPVAVEQPDLVVSKDAWFRPVDLKTGPDGGIYVADFYNRIIGHYEVPLTHPGRDRFRGRIWRIVADKENLPNPSRMGDLTRLSTDALLDLLGNSQRELAIRASHVLLGKVTVQNSDAFQSVWNAALESPTPQAQILALWIASRVPGVGEKRDQLIRKSLESKSPLVRAHAIRVLMESSKPNLELLDQLRKTGLTDETPMVRRIASEGMGRLPGAGNIDPLLEAAHSTPKTDDHLTHALKISLRNQLLPGLDAWKEVQKPGRPDFQRKLIALASLGVPSREAASYLSQQIDTLASNDESLTLAFKHIGRWGATEDLRMASNALSGPTFQRTNLGLLRDLIQGLRESGRPSPEFVQNQAVKLTLLGLDGRDQGRKDSAILLASDLQLKQAAPTLEKILRTKEQPTQRRLAAAQAWSAISLDSAFRAMLELLSDATDAINFREQIAIQVGKVQQPGLLDQLLIIMKPLPYRLQLPTTRELAAHRGGAQFVFNALSQSHLPPRLVRDRVVATRLEGSGVDKARDLVKKYDLAVPPGDGSFEVLLKTRMAMYSKESPSTDKGKELFTKHCGNCHQIGGMGAKVGPQLDGVGLRGLERLCEDILDPSRNVDQAFRQSVIALKTGQIQTGLVTKNEGNLVILVDAMGKDIPIERSNIEEQKVTNLSPMPANFAEAMNESDFRNLLGYLLAQRIAPVVGK